MADSYLYLRFPAGLVALGLALVVLLGLWLRRKICREIECQWAW